MIVNAAYTLVTLIRGEGNPLASLAIIGLGFLIYLAACPVFIFVLKTGVAGAGGR